MNKYLTAILIGLLAGVIDVILMLIRKLDKSSNYSAFLHYFALGLIIPFVDWNMIPWVKGVVIALMTSIPFMVLVYPKDKKAIIPMVVFSLILGAGIGIAGAKFIR